MLGSTITTNIFSDAYSLAAACRDLSTDSMSAEDQYVSEDFMEVKIFQLTVFALLFGEFSQAWMIRLRILGMTFGVHVSRRSGCQATLDSTGLLRYFRLRAHVASYSICLRTQA